MQGLRRLRPGDFFVPSEFWTPLSFRRVILAKRTPS